MRAHRELSKAVFAGQSPLTAARERARTPSLSHLAWHQTPRQGLRAAQRLETKIRRGKRARVKVGREVRRGFGACIAPSCIRLLVR